MYIKTKAKFQIGKIEDQIIVSLKNTYKMINIKKSEKEQYQIIEIMLTLLHLGKKNLLLGTVTYRKLKEIN